MVVDVDVFAKNEHFFRSLWVNIKHNKIEKNELIIGKI
jgi:hypothetical protein